MARRHGEDIIGKTEGEDPRTGVFRRQKPKDCYARPLYSGKRSLITMKGKKSPEIIKGAGGVKGGNI